jgi:hypothetical protein
VRNATLLAIKLSDDSLRLVSVKDFAQPKELARAFKVEHDWVVLTPDGRYDCDRPEALNRLVVLVSPPTTKDNLRASSILRRDAGLLDRVLASP